MTGMENKANNNEGIKFNLLKYLTACVKSWYLFIICIVVCAGLLVTYVAIKTPAVEVEASLILKDAGGGGSSFMLGEIARSFSIGDMFGGSSTTDNESAMLKSHTVFLRTVKNLGLNTMYSYRRFGFRWVPIPEMTPIRLVAPEEAGDTITTPLLFTLTRVSDNKWDVKIADKHDDILKKKDISLPVTFDTPYGKYSLEKTQYYNTKASEEISKLRILFMSDIAAADVYRELVNIYVPDRKADFINLSFVTPDAKFGKKLIDEIIRNYTDVSNIYKTDMSKQSLDLVNQRLELLVDELSVSEQDLEKFKLANKLTDVEVDAQYLMTKTGELETALLQAQTQFEVVKLTRDFVSNPRNNYELIPELLTSGSSTGSDNAPSQIVRYNEMILERMQLLSDAKSNSQIVKKLDEQIDAMRDNIISSVNRMYENSKVALNDLKSENAKTRNRVGELPVIERKYISLKRDNMLMEQMYLFLLQQREELNMSLATRSFPAQIVDPPHVLTNSTGLTKAKAAVFGGFLGGILAMALVFFLKMKTTPVRSLSEFESTNIAPGLGVLKKAEEADDNIVTDNRCANAETMRQLRSQVQDALKSCSGNVVAVTSLHDKEGKTYVATNLAVLLAKLGTKVLLLDCNMRRPGVANVLKLKQVAALAIYLQGNGNQKLATQDYTIDAYASMDVATAAITEENAADILGSEITRKLVEDLKKQYDYIVIDSSSIKGYSDIGYVTEMADVTLVVEKAGIANSDDINYVNELYKNGELNRIGVVANGFC